MKPRLAAYSRDLAPGGFIVRPAKSRAVERLLLVGYSRVAAMFQPPFAALCRDHRVELTVYMEPDWGVKIGELTARHRPDAIVVVTPEGQCADLTVWRADTRARRVVPVCPEATTPTGLAQAAARAWWHVEEA